MNFDLFGKSLAVGDFNGDGIDDLAVGIPGDDDNGDSSTGAVQILFGSASGLQSDLPDDQFIPAPPESCLESADVGIQTDETGPCDHRNFGRSITAGDYDGDGYSDLAVSQTHAVQSNRAVFVYTGGEDGLGPSPVLRYDIVPTDVSALSSGDFDGDGKADLVAGTPYESVGSFTNAGAVNVIYGSSSGLASSGDQPWHQDSPGVNGEAGMSEYFGSSISNARQGTIRVV